jgi:hypothetical protein
LEDKSEQKESQLEENNKNESELARSRRKLRVMEIENELA